MTQAPALRSTAASNQMVAPGMVSSDSRRWSEKSPTEQNPLTWTICKSSGICKCTYYSIIWLDQRLRFCDLRDSPIRAENTSALTANRSNEEEFPREKQPGGGIVPTFGTPNLKSSSRLVRTSRSCIWRCELRTHGPSTSIRHQMLTLKKKSGRFTPPYEPSATSEAGGSFSMMVSAQRAGQSDIPEVFHKETPLSIVTS